MIEGVCLYTAVILQHVTLVTVRLLCQIDLQSLFKQLRYNDVMMGAVASQITSLTIVYSTVYSDAD